MIRRAVKARPTTRARGYPNISQHSTAPTTVIERPHANSLLNNPCGSTPAGTPARQRAPVVESGDKSTRCEPRFIADATAIGSSPPSRSTMPGTVGRNAGSTTPDVLLYTETTPVTNATTAVTES